MTATGPQRERLLGDSHFSAANALFWPIAAVEFSDVPNHVNCTASNRSRSAAA